MASLRVLTALILAQHCVGMRQQVSEKKVADAQNKDAAMPTQKKDPAMSFAGPGAAAGETRLRTVSWNVAAVKNARVLEVLQTTHRDADVLFLQEVGNQLGDNLTQAYGASHDLILGSNFDSKRNKNSVMLLRKTLVSDVQEVDVPVDGWRAGDLLAVKARIGGADVTLASFHGDSRGLLTLPVLNKLVIYRPTTALLLGLDANAFDHTVDGKRTDWAFHEKYQFLGLASNWDSFDEQFKPTNPKDFILFTDDLKSEGYFSSFGRDNTDLGGGLNDIVSPSMDFPSDHALIFADLRLAPRSQVEMFER